MKYKNNPCLIRFMNGSLLLNIFPKQSTVRDIFMYASRQLTTRQLYTQMYWRMRKFSFFYIKARIIFFCIIPRVNKI